MSYNVAICLPTVSDSDAEAWQQINGLIDQEGSPPAVFEELIVRLMARYPCLNDLPDDQVDDGVWCDGPLRNNIGHQVTVLGISISRVDEVLPFLIETATSLGLVVFDWQSHVIHRGDGIAGLVMTVENEPERRAPTLAQILDAVDRMTPHGGPGFVIVERDSQDYVQTAGGAEACLLEWREYLGEGFQHWAVGVPGVSDKKDIKIPTNGHYVNVKKNEELTTTHVKDLLTAFVEQRPRPEVFVWRDITQNFR